MSEMSPFRLIPLIAQLQFPFYVSQRGYCGGSTEWVEDGQFLPMVKKVHLNTVAQGPLLEKTAFSVIASHGALLSVCCLEKAPGYRFRHRGRALIL